MAASKFRRPGWSRRAQYSLFFSFVALAAGLALGLILLAISVVAPRTFDGLRGAATDATRPAAEALAAIGSTVNGVFTGAGNYWDAASQNAELKEQRDRLRRQALAAAALERENEQLKAALELRERVVETIAAGRIIGSSHDSVRRFAVLSAGRASGVRNGMPVRSPDGLLGRIVATGAFSSRVLLISDRSAIVPARILRTGEPVIARGMGDGNVDLRPLEVGRNPFEPGDIIVTSGTGGLYPPRLPVARVVRLDDDGAVAVPLATPAQSSIALVEAPYEPVALADYDAPLEEAEATLPPDALQ
ncbi:rod shape-determining protein MreC [Sphingomicrobium astaxanthinifaciens]|uniref:rod shape-determining protein MreC n=1 Tax=Sphingomicrobium astaxanthinifaciens TaxID=1227949 RepID=UPI001FCBCF19|nr:rod shape-determining protein MreC [Sphingomicrobium astaxanthinifaciens]MCJ7420290.1 rod shape-determining protein MreC [Sphingomicrobium astaxanthinifaciens]